MLVLDTSVAANWCFPDESLVGTGEALRIVVQGGAVVPALFWFELRNVLVIGERRSRLTPGETMRALSYTANLSIEVDTAPVENVALSLARKYRLTFYDATYLELALRRIMPLATLDGDLIKAARGENVELIRAT